jgi:hypothetical protein
MKPSQFFTQQSRKKTAGKKSIVTIAAALSAGI